MAFTSGVPAALQPTQTKALYSGNYIDFTDSSFNQWAQQFLPDVYEQEVERYGNRSIGSFLRMVSAEMPSTSDQIIWTEQGRLHTRYANIVYLSNAGTMPTSGTTPGTASAVTTGGSVGNFFVPTAQPTSLGVTSQGTTAVNFRKGQTVMIVEAMKTMNHVPSTSEGEVKKILVEDGQPVEFGQTLVILK